MRYIGTCINMHHYHKFGVRFSFQFLTFMFSVGWSVCIYELCRDVISVVNLSTNIFASLLLVGHAYNKLCRNGHRWTRQILSLFFHEYLCCPTCVLMFIVCAFSDDIASR